MGISFISAATVNGDAVTLGTHTTGDLLLATSWVGSATPPTLSAGWTNLGTVANGSALAGRIAYKIATSAADNSGLWTTAQLLQVLVYRGTQTTLGTTATSNTGSGTTVTYPAVTLRPTNSTSWVVRFGASTASTNFSSATVTGYTFRNVVSTGNAGAYDSSRGLSSNPTTTNQTVSPTGTWDAFTVEVPAAPSGRGINQAAIYRSSLY